VFDDIAWVTREFHEANPKSQLQPGDILITRVGANAGDVCIVPEGTGELHCSSAVFARPLRRHRKYLELFCRSPLGQQLLRTRIVGSVSERINTRDVESLPVLMPTPPEEAAITNVLAGLDDKVQQNRQINETLESMARAIFKSWFVDFDPVRAKSEGRQPFGINAETAALFPSSFDDSPLGKIPKGWTTPKLDEIVELAYGKALKEENRRQGKVPVYGSNGAVGWHDEAFVKGPGIVVGRKGNPGIVTWAPTDFVPIDTTFYVLLKAPLASFHYAFHSLSLLDLASLGADSAVPGLNRNIAYMSRVLLPRSELIKAFDLLCDPLSLRVHLNDEESRTLAAIRDALLPKLISGEIRIKDAEKMAGERV